jgi:aminomethyltransferase
MEQLKLTSLAGRHREMHALMAPFGGWEMPIQYEGILAEHAWCRSKAALFDICHMGELFFEGDFDSDGLEDVFTFSVKSIPVGRSRYGFLLNEAGGILDDLIVFRTAADRAMIVVNAATAANDFKIIKERLSGGKFENLTSATGKLDLQGPLSREILTSFLGSAIASIPYFKFISMSVLGVEAIVSRTGYTGELGYEIFLPDNKVCELWDLLLTDPRVRPAGLGARDLLRLEVGYSLYGSDIDESTTPLEAGLEMFVDFNKTFVGKTALLKQKSDGPQNVKIAFRVDGRRAPRHDYAISINGVEAGRVTSGVYSPLLGCGIGIGYVKAGLACDGTAICISHERIRMEAAVCGLPFYNGGSLRA